jgi:hypothetical protein
MIEIMSGPRPEYNISDDDFLDIIFEINVSEQFSTIGSKNESADLSGNFDNFFSDSYNIFGIGKDVTVTGDTSVVFFDSSFSTISNGGGKEFLIEDAAVPLFDSLSVDDGKTSILLNEFISDNIVNIMECSRNFVPKIKLITPDLSKIQIIEGNTRTFIASAFDADDNSFIEELEWKLDSIPIGTTKESIKNINFPTKGNVVLSISAADSSGIQSTEYFNITVGEKPPVNPPPVRTTYYYFTAIDALTRLSISWRETTNTEVGPNRPPGTLRSVQLARVETV